MNPRILIVDDHEDNRAVLSDALADEGYELCEAADGAGALASMRESPPDLVLLDVMMPGLDGIECCRRIAADRRLRDVPVILVTALDAEQDIVAGLEAGATDYVTKPFSFVVVRALRAGGALRAKLARDEVRRLADRLERQNAELARLALHDSLTGLPNRILLHDRLEQAISRVRRDTEAGYALLFLDFDGFKSINDSWGHETGDLVLRKIAERMCDELREVDTVSLATDDHLACRLGGDEFVVLLESVPDAAAAARIAERLLARIAEPLDLDGLAVDLTASVGVMHDEGAGLDADAALRRADHAMYLAKRRGKACCVVLGAEA